MSGQCPACRSTRVSLSHHSVRTGLTTVRCRACGLRFIRQRMDDEQLRRFYSDVDACAAFAAAERKVRRVPQRRREWAGLLWTALHERQPRQAGSGRPRLLDIGCGAGDFLAVAKAAGFDAHGVELSLPAACLARRDHQLEVVVGDYSAEHRAGHFDVITLLGVLEHVRDPAGLLAHARYLLAPGGLLLIYTPVWGAYDRLSTAVARSTGGLWSRLIDRRINLAHLQIFPQRTLARLAASSGLVVHDCTRVCEYNLPVRHYLTSLGIGSERLLATTTRVVEALIAANLFFRNNQRVLMSRAA